MSTARIMTASALMSSGGRRIASSRSRAIVASEAVPLQAAFSNVKYSRYATNGSKAGRAVRLTMAPCRSNQSATASICSLVSWSVAWPGSLLQTATRRSFSAVKRGEGNVEIMAVSASTSAQWF